MHCPKWILFLLGFSSMAFCTEKAASKNQSLVSDDLAQVLWHVMKSYDGEYDFQQLVATLNNLHARKIKDKPFDECYASLLEALEKKASEKADLNLQSANSFIQKLETIPGINEIVKHKLYYKVIKPGKGKSISNFTRAPLISFKEKTVSGEILAENTSGIRIHLSETISGLRKGLAGIKVGEQRELFIHPDFAYGDFPKPEPYSLVIIEVTLISL